MTTTEPLPPAQFPDDIPTDDGAAFVHDGVTYRVRIEPDPYASIMDEQGEGVWCGRLEWGRTNPHTGHGERPAGFDGGAECLRYGCSHDAIWWQVPKDLLGEANREGRDATRRAVLDILEWGYVSVGLERLETLTDSQGNAHTVEVESAWLGMVEPSTDAGYLCEILADHLAELSDD